MLRVTGTDHAPWITVNAANRYFRGLTIATTILNAINARLTKTGSAAPVTAPVSVPMPNDQTLLTASYNFV